MKEWRHISVGEPRTSKNVHIEAPGCVVNIRTGLVDTEGRAITVISVRADHGIAGETDWELPDCSDIHHTTVRVRKTSS